MMTLDMALMYVRYSRVCPSNVSPLRWRAMVRFIEINYGMGWVSSY